MTFIVLMIILPVGSLIYATWLEHRAPSSLFSIGKLLPAYYLLTSIVAAIAILIALTQPIALPGGAKAAITLVMLLPLGLNVLNHVGQVKHRSQYVPK